MEDKHSYTEEQVDELCKCTADPIYFIERYVKIQDPVKGLINIKLYDFQVDMIRHYQENDKTILAAPRQVGKTLITLLYILWLALFDRDKRILICAHRNIGAMEHISILRLVYAHLPEWLRPAPAVGVWNKHEMGFVNDSIIMAKTTTGYTGVGYSLSLVFFDEFAFVRPNIQRETLARMFCPATTCIVTSTLNTDKNVFDEIYSDAKANLNDFSPMHVPWDAHPARDEKFKERTISVIGEEQWQQQHEMTRLIKDDQKWQEQKTPD